MPWPFGSSGSSETPATSRKQSGAGPDNGFGDYFKSLKEKLFEQKDLVQTAKEWTPVLVTAAGSSAALLFYQAYLRRFSNAGSIKDEFFRKRSLFGKVTSVGDGDGFHLFHTPGGRMAGWGWLRRVPDSRGDLKGQTISIRLAGVDAPEGAHFGRPGQPYAGEALSHLSNYVLHRRVRARIHKRDQYNRVVATVFVRRGLFKRDVGLELLRQGLATTYEAKSGIEWGGFEKEYKTAEARAKAKRIGMWSGSASKFESPRDYKSKLDGSSSSQESENEVKKPWWRRWF